MVECLQLLIIVESQCNLQVLDILLSQQICQMEVAFGQQIKMEMIFGQECQSYKILKKKKTINLNKLEDNKLELKHASL